jgi:hypothetical protein
MLRHSQKLAIALLLAASTVAVGDGTGAGVQPAAARTDLVLLVDVSGSMRKRRGLVRAREILVDVVENIVQPGTRVAIIPFGTGVHDPMRFEVPEDADGAGRVRGEIREAIRGIRARDAYTYLYEALYAGLDMLRVFKEANPGHARHVILISDGKQVVRRGEPRRNLAGVLQHFETTGFKRGDDWYIWYGHFGVPDDELSSALADAKAGSSIALDELPGLKWGLTTVGPDRVRLGQVRPGSWAKRFELTVRTNEAGIGQKVTLASCGRFPRGMKLTVTPAMARLTGRTTRIRAVVRCEGGQPGDYPDAGLVVRAARGRLHWVKSGTVALPFDVARPRVGVSSRLVALGRLAPGTRRKFTITLSPNEAAGVVRPRLWVAPTGVPAGVRLTVDRSRIRISRRTEVTATLTVARDARPGDRACRLVFSGQDVEIEPEEVRVAFGVGYGRITVGEEQLEFAPLQPGEETARELTLTPDKDTAGKDVEVAVEYAEVPDGLVLDGPDTVTVHGRTVLPLRLFAAPGTEAGVYTAKLRFRAPGDVRIDPDEVDVTFTVGALGALWLPPVVELGNVPASHAREVAGRLELAVSPHLEGAELVFEPAGDTTIEPRVVPLREGKLLVPLRIRSPETALGKHEGRFRAFVVRDGERAPLEPVAFRWRVVASFVRITAGAKLNPLPIGDSDVAGKIVVESSADLVGRRARLAVALPGLPGGMEVAVDDRPFTLKTGPQTVPVALHVTGARAGRYEGELRLALTAPVDGVTPTTKVPLAFEIAGAGVQVLALQGSLEGLTPHEDRELVLTLLASSVPVPTTLTLEVDRGGLPSGIEGKVPAVVHITQSDGAITVPLRFRMSRAVESGRWDVRITARTRTPGVAVAPDSVTVRASVPRTLTLSRDQKERLILWISGGIGALALAGFLVLKLLRRGASDSGYAYVQQPDEETLKELLQEDEMVVLEGFEDRRH